MIKYIDYKLTKQPGTISEEIYKPNKNLIDFIKNRKEEDSRILVIKASNSSGKSFLLNSIAYAFKALELPTDELSPTLRRSLNYLIDKEHQEINFEIEINDPSGFIITGKFNHLDESKIKITNEEGKTEEIDTNLFSNKYKLLYDIPENPLDRIYKLLKSIKEFNTDILGKLDPLDIKMREILKSIKDERDEEVIKKIENRINSNIDLKNTYNRRLIEFKEKLGDLENYENLVNLKRCLDSKIRKETEKIRIEKELQLLKPSSREKRSADNKKKISDLKKAIRDLRISSLLMYCKEEITENAYSQRFTESFSQTDINLFNYLFDNPESIVNDLLVNEVDKISKFLKGLESFKNISLEKVFRGLKSDFNQFDYKLVKDLKNVFSKYKESNQESDIVKGLFEKNSDLILKELEDYEKKLSGLDDLNQIQKELNNTLIKLINNVKKGFGLSKKLSKELTKYKRNKNNDYDKTKEKALNISESIIKDNEQINSLRNTLENNGIQLSDLNDASRRDTLAENLYFKNKYCKGKEKEEKEYLNKEIKKVESLLLPLDKTLFDDKVKLKVEDSKQSSEYVANQKEIQMFSNKLSFFTKYLVQRNGLINDTGELKSDNSLEYISYVKILGEYVASLMGKKIIYQDKNVDIAYIDYSSKTPYFVTPQNKRIAFSDFSGGQGSSNYLKAKLNINEERKFIVLIDEIANMDNKSLNKVIDRLKELDNKNKLLLAILVEPAKEPNTFNIRAY